MYLLLGHGADLVGGKVFLGGVLSHSAGGKRSVSLVDGRGVSLRGGGALLKGLDKLINQETGLDVYIAESPLDCVANGTGYVLDNMDVLGDVLQTDTKKL